ncbi:MAG: hypothetical protein JO197_11325 [Acidobacteria bacterium]|nr:hypothetical protein [Acidobacteriota bacterium]MBV9476066.1 hypothetical protein [Acidobacteriota bacterium]
MTLDDFERELARALLAGDDPLLETLRAQYAAASVRDRETNPNGFVTRFDVPASAPAIERKLLHLDDLQVELEGAKTPAEASLQVHDGRLRSLECFVYDGAFPESPAIRAAWYYGTERYPGVTDELLAARDVEELLDADDE